MPITGRRRCKYRLEVVVTLSGGDLVHWYSVGPRPSAHLDTAGTSPCALRYYDRVLLPEFVYVSR